MRLTPKQTEMIRSAARQVFGGAPACISSAHARMTPGTAERSRRDWVRSMERTPLSKRGTEAFAAKFNRLQDMFVDKLLPRLLSWLGEKLAPFIDDALCRAEKLGFVQSADDSLLARELRNKLVHEYVAHPRQFADALNTTRRLGMDLIESFSRVKDYVSRHRDV